MAGNVLCEASPLERAFVTRAHRKVSSHSMFAYESGIAKTVEKLCEHPEQVMQKHAEIRQSQATTCAMCGVQNIDAPRASRLGGRFMCEDCKETVGAL